MFIYIISLFSWWVLIVLIYVQFTAQAVLGMSQMHMYEIL